MRRTFPGCLLFLVSVLCLQAETFQNPRHIPTSADPQGLIVVDVNGDGLPDLVFVTQPAPAAVPQLSLNVLVAKADGSYAPMTPIALPANTTFRCVATDVNGDGKVDVVCPNFRTYPQSALATVTMFGNGDGSFGSPVTRSFTTQYDLYSFYIPAQGDLNGDGYADLVISDTDGSYLLLGDGSGSFVAKSVPGATSSGIVADVNGDGKADLLYSTGPYVALGNGDGTFSKETLYGENGSCLFKDVDGDGHLDAVCGSLSQGISILHGNSDGSFGTPLTLSVTGSLPSSVAPLSFADINGDGIADLVGLTPDGLMVLLGTGPLAFAAAVEYPASVVNIPLQYSNSVLDMNGDGVPDFVEAGVKSVLIDYGKKDGTFSTRPSIQTGHTIAAATVADFNGDGIPDVATEGTAALQVPSVDGDSLVLQTGKGDGTFSAPTALPQGGASFAAFGAAFLAHGDFNGDGKQDLLATSVTPPGTLTLPQTFLLLGHGDGSFDAPVVALGYALSNGTVLDVNQDGRDDLLLSTISGGNLQVQLADANGVFSGAAISSPVPQEYSASAPLVAGDFNNDGQPDVILAEQHLYFLAGKGDGSFNAAGAGIVLPITMGQKVMLAAGDFDGDDTLDVAALVDNTTVYVYYGNGDGTFSAPVTAAATLNQGSYSMGVADLDGDGRDDLVFGGDPLIGGAATAATIHGRAGRTFDMETDYEAGDPLSAPAIADFNRDGFPDVLFATSGRTFNILLNQPGPVVTHTLVASPEPSVIGQSVNLTASFGPPASGSEQQLSGQVTFFVDRVQAGVASITSNAATLALTTMLSPGVHRITATWPGDAVYGSLISHATHTVNKTPVTITIGAATNPARFGLPDKLTISVGNAAGLTAAAPSGSYTVLDGSTAIGGGVLSGTPPATLTTTFSNGATHMLSVTYSGDATHASAQASLSLGVQASPTVTILQVTPNPAAYGAGLQLTAAVTPGVDAGAPAFSDINTGFVMISGLPGGVMSLPIRFAQGSAASTVATVSEAIAVATPPGGYALTASFSGSTDLLASASGRVTEVVTPPPSTTTLSVTPSPGYQAHTVTLTAGVAGLLKVPTGTVQLLDGSTLLATAPLTGGTAVLATTALSAGGHSLVAVYGGDGSNGGSESVASSESILPYDFTIASGTPAGSLLPGGTSTAQLTLTSVGSFAEGVAFAVSSLPTGVTATIAPAVVTLSAGGTGTAVMTFSSAQVAATRMVPSSPLAEVLAGILLPSLLYLRRRSGLPGLLTVLICCVSVMGIAGCGSKTGGTTVTTQTVRVAAAATQTGQVHSIGVPLSVTR